MANQQSGAAGFIPKPTGALRLGTEQSDITSGTTTLVNLDTKITNFNDGIEDTVNHKITPGVAGFYMLIGQIRWKDFVVDKVYAGHVRLSGGSYVLNTYLSPSDVPDFSIPIAAIAYLSGTDYVQLYATQYSGVDTVDIMGGLTNTYLYLHRLR